MYNNNKILPKLLSVRDLIKIYGLKSKHQLSQNFLLDKNLTDKIIKYANINNNNNSLAIEVGPGPGLLTRSILETGVSNVIAIEKDSRFLPFLMQLVEASDNKLKLLVQWIKMISNKSGIFKIPHISMTLMFQKEVGNRIVADVKTKQRGRLSVLVQSLCDAKLIYNLSSSVDASVIQLNLLSNPVLNGNILRTLQKNLPDDKQIFIENIIEELKLNLNLRAEELSTQEFCDLSKKFYENSINIPDF
ncbi:13770_t:CDS:2 [Entrophospora sp. SA101]|nr:12841_t:CDS:2 [Entrophospora sp. SA101]CAJ0876887.1 13770_t:CDS:2 [Entrophospora sp. SA101]